MIQHAQCKLPCMANYNITCRLTLTSLTNLVDEMIISVLVDVGSDINIITLFRDNPVYAMVHTSSHVARI